MNTEQETNTEKEELDLAISTLSTVIEFRVSDILKQIKASGLGQTFDFSGITLIERLEKDLGWVDETHKKKNANPVANDLSKQISVLLALYYFYYTVSEQ